MNGGGTASGLEPTICQVGSHAALPRRRIEQGARSRIRAARASRGCRIAVLDDDPTGSQAVHDVTVVTEVNAAEVEAGLREPGSTCFVLTNSRSMSETDAVELNRDAGRMLLELGERLQAPIEIVSRGDSTLRGHMIAEVHTLDQVRRQATGRGFDGVLLAPAYFEAGRCTVGDVHYARVRGEWVPAGETEFARDATFGYRASNLRDFIVERSKGRVAAEDVRSIELEDIRLGGPRRVGEILRGVSGGAFVIVNATEYADFEVVVLGLLEAEEAGCSFLHRSGPSFVRALAGLDPQPPLTAGDLWPSGAPRGHGLLVAGSHSSLTTEQLEAVRARGEFADVELDVEHVLDSSRRGRYLEAVARRVCAALAEADVLLSSSRQQVLDSETGDHLSIARVISSALVEVVVRARVAQPAWVLAKGGITAHDVAVRGLEIRRATVVGQLLPGMVTVIRPVRAATEVIGMPYVIFAGNVGDGETLCQVINVMRGAV
jgi:uncharacterized protein YgbK (DUF1537 family)